MIYEFCDGSCILNYQNPYHHKTLPQLYLTLLRPYHQLLVMSRCQQYKHCRVHIFSTSNSFINRNKNVLRCKSLGTHHSTNLLWDIHLVYLPDLLLILLNVVHNSQRLWVLTTVHPCNYDCFPLFFLFFCYKL